MKFYQLLCLTVAAALSINTISARAEQTSSSLIYETSEEFFGSGDFDGDGHPDLIIVDKASGKFRLGYQLTSGVFTWVDCWASGIKDVTGFTIGKLLATNHDGLAFTSPDSSQIVTVDPANPKVPARPINVSFTAALGPGMLVAIPIGGETSL